MFVLHPVPISQVRNLGLFLNSRFIAIISTWKSRFRGSLKKAESQRILSPHPHMATTGLNWQLVPFRRDLSPAVLPWPPGALESATPALILPVYILCLGKGSSYFRLTLQWGRSDCPLHLPHTKKRPAFLQDSASFQPVYLPWGTVAATVPTPQIQIPCAFVQDKVPPFLVHPWCRLKPCWPSGCHYHSMVQGFYVKEYSVRPELQDRSTALCLPLSRSNVNRGCPKLPSGAWLSCFILISLWYQASQTHTFASSL